MAQPVIQPKWKTVEYSRSQIINAGKTIRQENSSEEDIKQATDIIASFNTLQKAYPNYFSDIGEFVTLVKSYLK